VARILVAEDDASVQEVICRALGQRGHQVTGVDDGLAALEALAASDFDLLLTDIRMPGLDGIALALKVSKDHPDMAIMMMTGYAAEEQRAHNLDVLIHRVVTKPFTLDEICAAAEETLAERPRSDA